MRDPYHAARQRFKVARDRLIEQLMAELGHTKRILKEVLTVEMLSSIDVASTSSQETFDAQLAAGILHTMLKFKVTDEQQALMLWKLSRE